MRKKKPEIQTSRLSRRDFMGLAGCALAPFSFPALGNGLPTGSQKNGSQAEIVGNETLDLYESAYFFGRQYFVLRSGRATMILQADRADLGPAFTYMLFDAEVPAQTLTKSRAFNFIPGEGAASSALQVELGGFLFCALGQRTDTRWVTVDGVPTAEAVWWAGGIKITEQFSALSSGGVFQRLIRLEGANIMGEQPVTLRLSLPAGNISGQGSVLVRDAENCQIGLTVHSSVPVKSNAARGYLDIGPLNVAPNGNLAVQTAVLVQIPRAHASVVMNRTAQLASASPVNERRATAQLWATASQLKTADRTIQELFDNARYTLPGMIAEDGSMDAGIFEYGHQWARDTSNSALGAAHAGHFDLAHAALNKVLTAMISDEGTTMVASKFEKPDLEELDQMGEILHSLKAYYDWSGDDSLIREHRTKLLKLIARPLLPQFRDSTGMVHDRREYWERTFDDAYELAYQTFLVQGLRDAADLAPLLGAQEHAASWQKEASRTLEAMVHHPTRALVDHGHLIKRRNVTGEIADAIPSGGRCLPGAPLCTESYHRLDPDTSMALPIALGIIDPASSLARESLNQIEQLWNARWSDGGYDRYNSSTQLDQPGPWPFACCFVLKAQHDAGLYDRSRRTLEWMHSVQGAQSGCWYEEIPSTRSQEPKAGLLPWTCGEVILFVVRHWLGVRFQGGRVAIRPNLYPGSAPVSADLRLKKGRLHLEIGGSGPAKHAHLDGRKIKLSTDGSVVLPTGFTSGTVTITTREKR